VKGKCSGDEEDNHLSKLSEQPTCDQKVVGLDPNLIISFKLLFHTDCPLRVNTMWENIEGVKVRVSQKHTVIAIST
jgi:hypothetical protein